MSLWLREDGLRIDRLLITTDTNFIPTGFGPAETEHQIGGDDLIIPLTRTLVYTYDNLYRLTGAGYSTGEQYAYEYDPVGNRLQQIIDGDTTDYLYDAANRLEQVTVSGQSPVSYSFDDNGNLLSTGAMTNTWDAANRLIESERNAATLAPIYNGLGDRVGQTEGITTTYFALDVMGLPEVIYTSDGNSYLHLPGVIMTESAGNEIRYLLSDGLGSVRQGVDDTGLLVGYNEYDPYGSPLSDSPFGFTGEWWENEVGLLHLRARWYLPETGTFLSRDPLISEQPYAYVGGNPVSFIDPLGFFRCDPITGECKGGYRLCVAQGKWEGAYSNHNLNKPCIVNANNIQTGNAPSWPSSQPPLWTRSKQPNPTPCPPKSPCKVEVFSLNVYEQLGFTPEYSALDVETGETVKFTHGHLGFILTDNLNRRRAYDMAGHPFFIGGPLYTFDLGLGQLAGMQYLITRQPSGIGELQAYLEEHGGGVGLLFWGTLGWWRRGDPVESKMEERVMTIDVPPQEACKKVECIINALDYVASLHVPYSVIGPNSNTAVNTALRRCGLQLQGLNHTVLRYPDIYYMYPGVNFDLN